MKNKIFKGSIVLTVMTGLLTITGCKKGENDPFLSLKSRKARITGEWTLEEGTVTSSQTSFGITSTDITTYTSSTLSQAGTTVSYTETLSIEDDGTFEVVMVQDGATAIVRGNWFFSGKSKDIDLKNKEAIVFSETQYVNPGGTSTYTGLYADQIILIDQLKNKEIIFKGDFSYANSEGDAGAYSYDRTFVKY